MRKHEYDTRLRWVGNKGEGTAGYRHYGRNHVIEAPDGTKPPIPGSSDPAFRGDADRWNPEELLVASVSACHKLWYLHLCADAGVIVTAYVDDAHGLMVETPDGGGRFEHVLLRPKVTIAPGSDPARAEALHAEAHAKCFIANSVNFPVECRPTIVVG